MPSKKSPAKPKPNSDQPHHSWAFEAIGTGFWIGIYEVLNASAWQSLQATIASRIEQFDATYSRFRADSLVTAMAERSGKYALPADGQELLSFYRSMYDATNGKVTPLIGNTMEDAGYDTSYSLRPKQFRALPSWDDALTVTTDTIRVAQPVMLDFGAAGKGYLIDIIAQLLITAGVQQFCIDAGGDLLCHNLSTALRIGLEQPDDTSRAIGIAQLSSGALCGSAGNRRAWDKFTHIIDPDTKQSPRHIKAVWTQARSAMLADGMATAIYFADPVVLQKVFSFEYVILYNNNQAIVSSGFSGELFTS